MADAAALAGDRAGSATSRWSAWVAVVAVLAGLVVSPPWQGGGGIPEGFVGRLAAGQLERAATDGWITMSVGDLVPGGARVRSGDGARVAVDGGDLWLASGTHAVLASTSELEAGSLLVEVPDEERAVRLGAVTASGRGAWRVDAGRAERVGVYRGGVGLRVGGDGEQALPVARYEQADLIAGGLPDEAGPLRYSAADDWDARLLAGLLAIDRQAAQLHTSFEGRFGTDPLPRGFYAGFTVVDPALQDRLPRYGRTDDEGRIGPPGAVLLGVVVTDLVADRQAMAVDQAVERVTSLRADGASWGVVLASHDLGAEDLRAAADLVLRQAGTAPPATPGLGPEPDQPPDGGAPDVPPGRPEPGDDPTGPRTTPPPSPAPPPSPPDEPAPVPCQLEPCEPANDAVDDVTDAVDDVTDVLDELLPGAGDAIDDLVSEVPTLLPLEGLP